ncbi:MAG: aminotransferase class V-fold PLP-dependent enzyme, partial [Candidatus Hadarchaeum sp.]
MHNRKRVPVIYFDNAATTWPKPSGVAEAVVNFLLNVGGSPGRSGHRLAVEANRIVYDAREALAKLFGVEDPLRIIFTANV